MIQPILPFQNQLAHLQALVRGLRAGATHPPPSLNHRWAASPGLYRDTRPQKSVSMHHPVKVAKLASRVTHLLNHVQRPMGGPIVQPSMAMRQQTMPPPQQMQAGNRGSQRGSKTGRVDSRPQQSRKDQEKDNSKMPLTAGSSLKPLEASGVGWKPTSIGRVAMPGLDPSGHMAPDMVQPKGQV